MKTSFLTKEQADAAREWVVVDAEGQAVGRLASKIALILRGKHKPAFCAHNDSGDFVVVVNAAKAVFSGGKENKEFYYRHTGYVGGIKKVLKADLLSNKPEDVIKKAVKGMLPGTTLGRAQLKKLKVYRGSEHPHAAQQPQALESLAI